MNSIERPSSPSMPGYSRVDASTGTRSVLDILAALLLGWRRILLFAVCGALLSIGVGLVLPRKYVVNSAVMTQTPGGSASLAGLASQFGVNLGGSSGGPSPELYASLLGSDYLVRRVVDQRFVTQERTRSDSTNLARLLGVSGSTPREQRANAVQRLHKAVETTVDDQSGLVLLTVTTKSPSLSLQIAQHLLSTLDEINAALRQRQADAESRFVQARVAEQAASLRQAEDQVQQFMTRNRTFQTDPELSMEYQRLNRGVQIAQDIYTSLVQSYQQARIDAERNTPTVSVLTEPMLPDTPASRQLLLLTILGLVAGCALAVLSIVLREYLRLLQLVRPRAFERVLIAWRQMLAEMRQLLPGRSAAE